MLERDDVFVFRNDDITLAVRNGHERSPLRTFQTVSLAGAHMRAYGQGVLFLTVTEYSLRVFSGPIIPPGTG